MAWIYHKELLSNSYYPEGKRPLGAKMQPDEDHSITPVMEKGHQETDAETRLQG